MEARLYGMVHSHAVLTARMALERCGVEVDVVDVVPGLHAPVVRAAGFPGWTVPAVLLDGQRLQGTLAISRELDRRFPAAGLFPRDAAARRAVEEAERWGHDELQALARRIFRWAGAHSNAVRAWMAREVVGLPAPGVFGIAFTPMMLLFSRHVSGADDATVRADLRPAARPARPRGRARRRRDDRGHAAERGRPADPLLPAPAARARRPAAAARAVALRPGRPRAAAGLPAAGLRGAVAGPRRPARRVAPGGPRLGGARLGLREEVEHARHDVAR
jgi:hypothetical protein